MHSSLTYTGFNLDDIKAMLTDHFGPPGKDAAWDTARVSSDTGAIQTGFARHTFKAGDTVHVKRTSIIVELG